MNDLYNLAAGVVCAGFKGTRAADVDERLKTTPFAGFILFARNIETLQQTRDLVSALQQTDGTGLKRLVAIDQEGGRVARLRDGVEEVPSMMALSATGDLNLAQRAGQQMAFDLRRIGVNVDFAPVLDLALYQKNTVIGARSFGDDPRRVARFAGAYADGLESAGVAATYKHFPGHGSTDVDSHLDLPVIDLDEKTLRERDLVPFMELLPSAQAVMTAHIVVSAIDPGRAATVSRALLTGVLRNDARFKGVCFTDCMEMDAIARGIGSTAGAVQALSAGADCVLVSHSIDLALRIVRAICDAVESGALDRKRLQEAYDRVAAMRMRVPDPMRVDAMPPHPGIGREIGRRAVTQLRGCASADAASSIVVSFEGTTTEGVQGTHTYHAAFDVPHLEQIRLPLEPRPDDVAGALRDLQARGRRPIVLMRRAHVYGAQLQAVRDIIAAFPDALVVSTREPYDAFLIAQAQNVLCTYGDDTPSMQGLGDVIFGGSEPSGRLPLEAA